MNEKKMFVDKHQACGAHDIKGSKRIEGLEVFFDLFFSRKKNTHQAYGTDIVRSSRRILVQHNFALPWKKIIEVFSKTRK
jgi:hypothetical protein